MQTAARVMCPFFAGVERINMNRKFGKEISKAILAVVGGMMMVAATVGKDVDEQARTFIHEHEQQIRPLEITVNQAWWNANTTGEDAAFEAKVKAQNEL